MHRPRLALLALPALAAGACSEEAPEEGARAAAEPASATAAAPAPAVSRGALVECAAERGLAYVNRSGEPSKPTILEANGAGVALFDLAGDGDLDLAFGQGVESLDALVAGPGADLSLWENDGSARFAELPGPGLAGWWTGLAAGDVDGDGDADLVAGAYGDLALLVQDETGTLARRPDAGLLPSEPERPGARLVPGAEREPGTPPLWATSLALLDADGDGALDLYVGQYLDLDPVRPAIGQVGDGPLAVPCTWKGQPVYCGPHGLAPQPDRFLVGDGTGAFRDESAERLPGHVPGYTLAVGSVDADLDGDTDLYVANDSVANLMLVNEGGRFLDAGLQAGVAVNRDGAPEAGMGVAVGDANRDGLPDLAVTNFSDEPTQLYLGAPTGFRTETYRAGLGHATRRLLSWSTHLVDLDADGLVELFTANGHVYPQADAEGTGTRYAQRDTIWTLVPGERAIDFAPAAGVFPEIGSRGSATGDLDGDGAVDLVVAHLDGPAGLFLNRTGAGNARLAVRCLGPEEPAPVADGGRRTPRDGRGTRVIVRPAAPEGSPDARPLALACGTAEGYQSASSPWLHFGLGRASGWELVEVRWPSGRVETIPAGAANRRIWIREGEGIVRSEPFAEARE